MPPMLLFRAAEAEEEEADAAEGSVQHPAFAVAGEPIDEHLPPADGLEYLRRVRKEALALPAVVRSEVTATAGDGDSAGISEELCWQQSSADLPRAPRQLLPTRDWEDMLLADFTALRAKLRVAAAARPAGEPTGGVALQLPPAADSSAWDSLCLGSRAEGAGQPPVASLVLRLDQRTCMAVLHALHARLERDAHLSHQLGCWAFALLARLESALPSEHAAALRAFLRTCALTRANLLHQQGCSLAGQAQRGRIPADVLVHAARLNTLICIIGRFFGQASEEELSSLG